MHTLDQKYAHKAKVSLNACAVSPSGTVVVTGGSDGTIQVIRSPNMILSQLEEHKYSVTALQFTPCGQYVISGSADYSVIVWNIETGGVKAKLMHHKAPVRCLSVSNDGALLISGAGDQTFGLINLLSYQFLHHLLQNESDAGMLSAVCFASDSSFVIGAATSGTLFVYDVSAIRAKCTVYDSHEMGVNACCTTQVDQDHILCTVGSDSLVKLWKVDNKRYTVSPLMKLRGHSGPILCCRVNDNILFTGSVDKSVILWDIESGEKLHQSVCHDSMINSLSLADNLLVTCSSDMTVKLWRVNSGRSSSLGVDTQISSKLSEWSAEQVQSWLSKLNLTSPSYTGSDLANIDLDTLTNTLTEDELIRTKLKKSIMLLRCFDGIPSEFLCPISIELMTDPVVANDGHSYNRASITEWLSKGNVTSPFTNAELSNQSLVANHNLRNLIETVFF